MPGEHYIGTKNNDLWLTDAENDMLEGMEGADELYAGAGDDVIEGGAGDDILNGESGNDTYVYRLGDGNDLIADHAGIDTIRFDASINASNVKVLQEGDHLALTIQAAPDVFHKITVANWFIDEASRVETVQFTDSNGKVVLCWDIAALKKLALSKIEN